MIPLFLKIGHLEIGNARQRGHPVATHRDPLKKIRAIERGE
ncbi:MAG: hypothetical protein OXB88_05825 [Bacteriovoracales bacterium]|nr:hypothetical protein [Bacteriovoracales bacterium]